MDVYTIEVIYDPTTRRISLAEGSDLYGGATTDVDSVELQFTGITAEGSDFIARVDFAVPVKTENYVIQRPFVLLTEDSGVWSAVIPNAVLMATRETKKLPFQLVLANDSQVVNSRNAIVLETAVGIDAAVSGDDLPGYEMPEWPMPTGVSESIDVHIIDAVYDPTTRALTLSGNDLYGGATIDTFSVKLQIAGIPAGYDARADFAVPIRTEDNVVIRPFVVLDKVGSVFAAMVPQAVLMAAKETKKLPFQLVLRKGDMVVNSRNAIVLEITRAINAMESVFSGYTPYVMYRNDTWEWISDFTYGIGSVVTYNGEMYVSLTDDNIGLNPATHGEAWSIITGITNVAFAIGGGEYIYGTVNGSLVTFSESDVVTLTKYTYTPVSLTERDGAPDIEVEYR